MTDNIRWVLDNPHLLSQMKTELIWEGKYDEYGHWRTVNIAGCAMPLLPVRASLPHCGGGHVHTQTGCTAVYAGRDVYRTVGRETTCLWLRGQRVSGVS
jgi:hypothetical protein